MQKRKEIKDERIMSCKHKYLRYWDHDYPYLSNINEQGGSLFPVPEKSNGQIHLRAFNEMMSRSSF